MARTGRIVLAVLGAAAALTAVAADPITYEGELSEGGLAANGRYDFRFRLFNGPDASRSKQLGPELVTDDVEVRQGRFSVDLDFGPGAAREAERWLEIAVARADRLGGFTRLQPLQPVRLEGFNSSVADVPAGAVAFFDLAACPSGWSELVEARGRTIVGVQPGGTLGGTEGSPLSDLAGRAHAHSFGGSFATQAAGHHNHL